MQEPDDIISFLLKEKILDEPSLKELVNAGAETGKSLISILRSRNLISQDQLTKLVAATNRIEFVNLSPDMIDPMAVRLVPYDIVRRNNLIPVRIEKNTLFVAMSSPLNLSVRDTIATKTGYEVIPLAATVEAIKQVITYHFNVESVTKQDIVAMRLKGTPASQLQDKKSISAKVADAPIVRLVDSLITGAIDAHASDIHIEPDEPDMRVRYRIDGILRAALEVPSSVQREVISHIKILADMDISERRIPQDGHISIHYHGKEYDLRISSLPATGGEKIVIRVLDTTGGLMSLDEITSSSEEYDKFNSLITKPYGMILLTGPTGSGKTTTLYSIIQELNKPEKNIVTIEDPVEYRLKGITQVQVKSEIGRTFAAGLRSIVRQDPDIILIGEIRDYETAEIAISAALTGHLVLSTLHTNDAIGAISRFIRLGIPAFQVASALLGIVAQRLVRTICPDCKEAYKPSSTELKLLSIDESSDSQVTLHRGRGCDACWNIGYRKRAGIYEMLESTHALKSIIVEGGSDERMKEHAIKEGMKTLRMQGISNVLRGSTTLQELTRVVDMREE